MYSYSLYVLLKNHILTPSLIFPIVGAFKSELIGQNFNDIISHEQLTEFPVLSIEPKQSP